MLEVYVGEAGKLAEALPGMLRAILSPTGGPAMWAPSELLDARLRLKDLCSTNVALLHGLAAQVLSWIDLRRRERRLEAERGAVGFVEVLVTCRAKGPQASRTLTLTRIVEAAPFRSAGMPPLELVHAVLHANSQEIADNLTLAMSDADVARVKEMGVRKWIVPRDVVAGGR
jgi:hypothetical protein